MNRPQLLAWFLLATAGFPAAAETPGATAARPNIVFILADDLGIPTESCYGADHFKTPHLDALARSGFRFEHCYASPLCGPSRAMLMTGRYAYHTGMTGNKTGHLLKPATEVMMPRMLKSAGYVTAQCGKWDQLPLQPADWGFDEYLRFEKSGQYWNTQKDSKAYTVNGRQVPLRDGEYLPDKMHEFVADFISRHQAQPFFLYYAMSHVHDPILPTPDTKPGTKDRWLLYQDNVVYMDKLVGKLLAVLDRLKLRNNTLVVFAGDNGTWQLVYQRCTIGGQVLSGCKQSLLEGGALVPCIASWPGRAPAGQVTAGLISLCDFYPTFATLAGAKLPAGVTIDGRDFAPQLLGRTAVWPRDWIFVQLGRHWYNRDRNWKLNESRELFDMRKAPFAEPMVPADTRDAMAIAARQRLQGVLNELNPAGGIQDPGAENVLGPYTGSSQLDSVIMKSKAGQNNDGAGGQPGNKNEPGE